MILAAGMGSRLSPYTDEVPKPMIQIGQKPILQHTVESLSEIEVRKIAINLHYLPEVIRGHFGSGADWGCEITYSYEDQLLGTAGALKPLSDFFDDTFLIWYGDNLCHLDLHKLVDFHRQKSALATIVLFWRDDVTNSGVAELDPKSKVVRFLEKPKPSQSPSHWVNAGVYLLEPEILDFIPESQAYDFGRDLFPHLIDEGKSLYGYCMSNEEKIWWIDRIEDYEAVLESWGPNEG